MGQPEIQLDRDESTQGNPDLPIQEPVKLSFVYRNKLLQVLGLILCGFVNFGGHENNDFTKPKTPSTAKKDEYKDDGMDVPRLKEKEEAIKKDQKYKDTVIYHDDFIGLIFQKLKDQFESIKTTQNYRMLSKLIIELKSLKYNPKKCTQEEWILLQDFITEVIHFISSIPVSTIEKNTDARLEGIVNDRDGMYRKQQKDLDKTEDVYKIGNDYYIDIDNETWQIKSTSLGIGNRKFIFSLVGNEYGVYFHIECYESDNFDYVYENKFEISLEPKTRFNQSVLAGKIKEAKENFKNQTAGKEKIKNFDLPKDEEIGYLSILASEWDQVTRSSHEFLAIFPSVLRNSNYQISTQAMGDMPYLETDDPHSVLNDKINEYYQKGIRYFVLNLNGHSSMDKDTKGISFNGKKLLTADDLIKLFEEYPDCKFTVTTIACNGAFFRDPLMEYFKNKPETAKRVAVFLQSKPDIGTPTHTAYLNPHPVPYPALEERDLDAVSLRHGINRARLESYSTTYNLFLVKFLLSNKTFGEAAYLADLYSQKHSINNPESIIDGQLIP